MTAGMIELEHVEFGWLPDSTLLAISHLTIASRERVFLRGPSGSGKSTLLGLIGGVLEPRRGRIAVDGIDLTKLTRSRRDRFRAERIGFIFQMFNLIPYLSVADNVMLPAQFSRERKRRTAQSSGSCLAEAHRLLDALGLDPSVYATRSANRLSHGQQQRVAAARALFGSPQLVIADEPTSSLDADTREQFLQLLMRECRIAEATLLFVSHDTSLRSLFDREVELRSINAVGAQLERAA